MGLPRPEKYSLEELAACWGCTTGLILDYVNSDKLEMKEKIGNLFAFNPQTAREEFIENTLNRYFEIEEVLRFEAEHDINKTITTGKPKAAKPPLATAQTRTDALKKILVEIVSEFKQENNRTPQYQEVLHSLKRLCKDRKHPVIQEISEGVIYWKSAKGKDKTTTVKQLQNRLTGIHVI